MNATLSVLVVAYLVAISSAAFIKPKGFDLSARSTMDVPRRQFGGMDKGNVCLAEHATCKQVGSAACCPCMSCSCRSGAIGLSETCYCTKTTLDRIANFFKAEC